MSALDDLQTLLASPEYLQQRLGAYKVDRLARQVIAAFEAVAVEQSGGGGGIRIVATTAVLRGDSTVEAPEQGTLVSVAEVSTDFDGSPVLVPGTLQWSNLDWTAFEMEAQDDLEPALVIPDDRWAEGDLHGVGCWINPLALLLLSGGGGGVVADVYFPLPLNISPDPALCESFGGLQTGYTFLTGPGHAQPYKVGTWDGTAWTFAAPVEGTGYQFSPRWSLPGGFQRMFITAYAPSYTPKWQVRSYNAVGGDPYIWLLNGRATSPAGLSHVPQIGEVFVVKPTGISEWAGHDNEFAWLDGGGETWVFSGSAVGGLEVESNVANIRDVEGNKFYPIMYRSDHGWSQPSATA